MEEKPIEVLSSHESGVRSIIASAKGQTYQALHSLEEAQNISDGVVIFEGDYGGTIYLTCPADKVKCSVETLKQLLADIDDCIWNNPHGAKVLYERHQIGSGIAGGMGGGIVTDGVWIHKELTEKDLHEKIEAVLKGQNSKLQMPEKTSESMNS